MYVRVECANGMVMCGGGVKRDGLCGVYKGDGCAGSRACACTHTHTHFSVVNIAGFRACVTYIWVVSCRAPYMGCSHIADHSVCLDG